MGIKTYDRREVDQVARARDWAEFYRDVGFNPLPSAPHEKKPQLSTYAEYYEVPLPQSIYDNWRAPNIQLMTGVRWRLLVVDCDGERAHEVWHSLCIRHDTRPRTWTVHTGGNGWHYYFRLPEGLPRCPSRRIWALFDPLAGPTHNGDWLPDHEIRILGDRALVVAPPSSHVESRLPYWYLEGKGPKDIDLPQDAPAWLLELPPLERPRGPVPPKPRIGYHPGAGDDAAPDRDLVLQALGPVKHLIAEQYGLRLASRRPNPDGWVSCHAIDREDSHPSASIHHDSGVYFDFAGPRVMSFFDLLAAIAPGVLDWRDALRHLAADRHIRRRAT